MSGAIAFRFTGIRSRRSGPGTPCVQVAEGNLGLDPQVMREITDCGGSEIWRESWNRGLGSTHLVMPADRLCPRQG